MGRFNTICALERKKRRKIRQATRRNTTVADWRFSKSSGKLHSKRIICLP
jgi:hypothetical protein